VTPEWIALVIARWMNFLSTATLFGMALFLFYAPPDSRKIFEASAASRRLLLAGGAIAFISTLGWACAALVDLAGDVGALFDRGAWSSFLFDTSFGVVWMVRGALATALAICAARGARAHMLIVALSACLLLSQSWIGHVAALPQPARWGVALAHAAHVLGAGAWLGGLMALIVVLSIFRPRGDATSTEEVLTRFSTVGLAAVAAILVGGVINVVAQAQISTIPDSQWGRILGLKLMLVLMMLGLASLNRFVLLPGLSKESHSRTDALFRSIALEQALGVAVLGLTAALGILDPAS